MEEDELEIDLSRPERVFTPKEILQTVEAKYYISKHPQAGESLYAGIRSY